MEEKLSKRNIIKLFFKLLPVQIFVQASSSLSSLVNGSIVGNALSALDMSALGLVTPFSTIVSAIASIVSGGMGIICGNLMGKGDKKKINAVFSICINALFVMGLLVTGLSIVLRKPIATFCGASSQTIDSTVSYLFGISIGIIPTLIIPCLMTFLQLANESNFSLIATIVLAVFNYIFDLLNINVLKQGIFGIGLASSISSYLILFIIIIFIKKKKVVNYNLKEVDFPTLKQVFIYGFPFALANILYSIRNIYINNVAQEVGGVIAINALAILSSFCSIGDAINVGIGSTYRMLASVYVGERDSYSLKKLFKNTLIISELIIVVKVLIMIIFGEFFATIFGATGQTITVTGRLFYLFSLSCIFNIPTIYLVSTYLTLGKSTYCNVIYGVNAFIAPIICCFISARCKYLDGIFSCYYIAEIVTLICIFVIAIIKNKKFKLNFKQLFGLPDNFDTDNKLSISINSIKQVINSSVQIEEFCLSQGIDNKRAKLAGLCLEEMASNIVAHGFNKDKKIHSIDIFIFVENNEISIRLKDDCIGFDPNTRANMHNPDDPCKNVGIRLVSRLAKQMNYQSTFGMNVLTIVL